MSDHTLIPMGAVKAAMTRLENPREVALDAHGRQVQASATTSRACTGAGT